MPLYHALFKKFFKKNNRESGHSDDSYSNNTKYSFFKSARFKKSSGTVDTEDGVTRPGLVLLSNTSRTVTDDGDDARLVNDTKALGGICVTKQTAQLSERITDDSVRREPDCQNPAGGFPWGEGSSA